MAGRRRGTSRGLNLFIRASVGVVILGFGIGSYQFLVNTKPKPPLVEQLELAKTVRTITVSPAAVTRTWSAFGAARPLNEADVAAEVAARVVRRPVGIEAGASVQAGDVLVELDGRPFLAQAQRARDSIAAFEAERSGLSVEERTLTENLRLAKENTRLLYDELELLQEAERARSASRIEIDRLRRQITGAERNEQDLEQALGLIPARRARLDAQIGVEQANLELAEIDVERTAIVSPISGTVQDVYVREGERVSPGSPIARVTDLSRMEIPLQIPVSAAGSVGIGAEVTLRSEGAVSSAWLAVVTRVAPEADPASRTVTVFAELEQDPGSPDRAGLLQPGRFVMAGIPAREALEAIIVPRVAVIDDRVMVVGDGDLAWSRPVVVAFPIDGRFETLDPDETQWLAIDSGLEVGDRVITSNLDELRHGSPVRPQASSGAVRAAARDAEASPIGGSGERSP